MQVLDAADRVADLRFLPDGRLLTYYAPSGGIAAIEIWPLDEGERVRIDLPPLPEPRYYSSLRGSNLVVHPSGQRIFLCWHELLSFNTMDGSPCPGPAHSLTVIDQMIQSADGTRLLLIRDNYCPIDCVALDLSRSDPVVLQQSLPHRSPRLAGFLPDGEHFLLIAERRVRLKSFASAQDVDTIPYPADYSFHAQISPDGRYLGVFAFQRMYLFPLNPLGTPRLVTNPASGGNIFSFAFHPAGRTLAAIHGQGGPTLVKIYDLDTLTLRQKLNWKVGRLTSVAFSPDGLLGAVGTQDGRVVLWDCEE